MQRKRQALSRGRLFRSRNLIHWSKRTLERIELLGVANVNAESFQPLKIGAKDVVVRVMGSEAVSYLQAYKAWSSIYLPSAEIVDASAATM